MLKDQKIFLGYSNAGEVSLLPQMANRHGLVAGATGTGKTVTVQVLAEGFSSLGVPVFLSDIKGDLSGMLKPGMMNDKIKERLDTCKVTDFDFKGFPVSFFDVFQKTGTPIRTTITEMGPLLLGSMLSLNETQIGVLHIVFDIADDENFLLIDIKDLKAMLAYVGENREKYTFQYGNVAKSSIGAIQRSLAILEDEGADLFFGEPAFDIDDFMQKDENGMGMVNILSCDELFRRPKLYTAFMLFLLSKLYEELPEVGDMPLPKVVFFFDEAHLLFDDCSKELLTKIEQTVRLIRSKGVGVFFCTQTPTDLPSSVLSQLSARVQHALRAFTKEEQKVIKTVADTFRVNEQLDLEDTLMTLKTGEALLSFLQEDGTPSVVQRAIILPPQSSIGAISDSLRKTCVDTAPLKDKYQKTVDRVSAYESLNMRFNNAMVQNSATENGIEQSAYVQQNMYPQQGNYVEQRNYPQQPAFQPATTQQPMTFNVYNSETGAYETHSLSQMQPANMPFQTEKGQINMPQNQMNMPQYQMGIPQNNMQSMYQTPQSYRYNVPKVKAKKEKKPEKSTAEKLLESFTRSTVTGAAREIGRGAARSLMGILGLNKRR